jgi:hypothetical protein
MKEVTAKQRVHNRIKRASKGTLFIVQDFLDIASRASAKATLNELVKMDKLERVYNGIFLKPRINRKFNLNIPPTTFEIASEIARKNHQTIVPANNTALNILGFSTQVPVVEEYVTDGPTRSITLPSGQTLLFKHSGKKTYVHTGNIKLDLSIEVLQHIKFSDTVDEIQLLKKISNFLSPIELQQLKTVSKFTTAALSRRIRRIEEFLS